MFWFFVALVFFILWIAKKPKGQNTTIDTQSSYDQGFWDGWRAFGRKVESDITDGDISKNKLQSYVDAGVTGSIPGDSNVTSRQVAQEVQPAPSEIWTIAETVPAQPEATVQQAATVTPEDKERLALKNLNTMLYIASFLIVAAAAAFIASNTPEAIRLILLWVIAGLFYGGGLALYSRSKRLKPAAVSFVGTGLAILPFAGLALSTLGGVSGQLTWFITSLVGIVAYAAATIILRQTVIAYLTLAFVLSLASSMASVLQLPLVWSFVAVMVVALVAHFVAIMWPKSLPTIFARPIEQTGQYVTPIALIASLSAITQLSLGHYTLIFAVAALQYTVYWMGKRTYVNEGIARALVVTTFVLLGFTVGEGSVLFITTWQVVLTTLNALYSLIRVKLSNPDSKAYESAWLWLSIAALLTTITGWIQASMTALGITITVELILLIAGAAAFRLREINWAYVCLAASVVLPYSVGAWLTNIPWYTDIYPWLFLAASYAALLQFYYASRARRSEAVQQFTVIAFCVYTIVATIAAVIAFSTPLSLWMAAIGILIALSCTTLSYLYRHVAGEAVAVGYVALAISAIVWNTSDDHTWHSLIIVGTLYLILLIGGLIHAKLKEKDRTLWILGAAQLVVLGFTLGILQSETRLTSVLLLLVAATGAAVRYIASRRNDQLNTLYAASTLPYLILAWCSSLYLAQGWQVLILSIAAIIYWVISYRAAKPLITIGANIAILGAVITTFSWANVPAEWYGILVGWTAASAYALWYAITLASKDTPRTWIHITSLWVVLGGAALTSLGAEKAVALAACGTIALLALFIALHGYVLRRSIYLDISLFILSFAVQVAIAVQWPNAPATIYGHLSAATLLGVGLWRRYNSQTRYAHYVLAAAALTLGAAISAFTENTIYQLVFLIEHVTILIVGGLMQWQKVVWWGVGSTVAAILYFLKDYFFLWLAFLGIVLIMIVIWRLSKINKTKQ